MKVAVAVIFNAEKHVLITRRAAHATHGGMWEFPGGKLEPDESPSSALIREIKEEVDIDILDYLFLGEVTHQYNDKLVHLLIFSVYNYLGKARCCESQTELRWVKVNELNHYDFPEANNRIIALLNAHCR
ncbi:8-oxo-dGTP diphosphatase MutT [Legionella fairfieldensis]|uniref:8-oxo-dGTP diphosphatase MutT n=1 Tax=Legionella fairfieldensis TaxID=45064 RepID=UPI00048EFFA6|nr:8-oxo-dGTP diphosphatase MutT [Legionella fairfieldensis]